MLTHRQRILSVLAPSAVLWIAWLLWQYRTEAAFVWTVGLLLGAALSRSRFCVAAAFRDLKFGDTLPARAVLLALGLSSLSFASLQYRAWLSGSAMPGNVYPVSAATAIGAVLFGIGMIPAGGCACSVLLRAGEGHIRYLYTLLGLIVGSVLGAYHFAWWEGLVGATPPLHLPSLLGWPSAILFQAAMFAGLIGFLTWWERRRTALS